MPLLTLDAAMKHVVAQLAGLAPLADALLIRGEPGTGKRLLARAAHVLAGRTNEPVVLLDCAAVAPEQLERELFGADDALTPGGLLGAAGAGTLVVTEVAAVPMPVQARLLRALEERAFIAAGLRLPLRCCVAALTCADLERAVARRAFRQDLYYRLSVASVSVPSLLARTADVLPLADFFVQQTIALHRRPALRLSSAAAQALRSHVYGGNVAELRALIEHAALSAAPPEILPSDLPAQLTVRRQPAALPSLAEVERAHIAEVLAATEGQKTQAAAILGISRKTLLEKRKRYGIE